jgi:preprotein translocase subunit SecA
MTDELMRRFGGDRMAAMMEKFNMPEDEAMEHKMLSRSIESAQKKIEGHHFDARKHLVQYDDVMNIHREKIYTERRKMLGSDSVLDDVQVMLEKFIVDTANTHAKNTHRDDDWTTDELQETLKNLYPLQDSGLEKLDEMVYRDEVEDFVREYMERSWAEKQAEYPPAEVDKVAKWLVLRSTDELWLEHINSMTGLRDRVALSGYAQKDPVMEYKKEAYEMFVRLLNGVRNTSIMNLLRVQFQRTNTTPTAPQPQQTNQQQIEKSLEDTGEYDVGTPQHTQPASSNAPQLSVSQVPAGMLHRWKKETGRNDACPCGSGQKFKKCHGA